MRYDRETMNQYSVKFAARAQATAVELQDVGLGDESFRLMCEHPTNPLGIEAVGQRLGEYAERLP
jgi:hypothetical protein